MMWPVAIVLVVGAVAFAAAVGARRGFERRLEADVERVEDSEVPAVGSVDEAPERLRQYVDNAGLPSDRSYRYARIRQEGEMKLGEERDWQSFGADQWLAVGQPAFLWRPTLSLPVGTVTGVDQLVDGEGRLEMRLFGAIRVAHAIGPEIRKAQLLRYMAELPWVPAAFRDNDLIDWSETDGATLRATASLEGTEASVDYSFGADGDIVEVSTDGRPREENGETVERAWGGAYDGYESFDGIRIPTEAEVYWDLPEGRFTYFRTEIVDFELV